MRPSIGLLAFLLIAGIGVLLAVIGGPGRERPAAAPPPDAVAPPSQVAAAGAPTLVSTSVDLPDDAAAYPPGPHVDLVTTRCAACHSPSMVLTQPRLSAEQWQAEVTKMHEVYRAPLQPGDQSAIVEYLTAVHGKPG